MYDRQKNRNLWFKPPGSGFLLCSPVWTLRLISTWAELSPLDQFCCFSIVWGKKNTGVHLVWKDRPIEWFSLWSYLPQYCANALGLWIRNGTGSKAWGRRSTNGATYRRVAGQAVWFWKLQISEICMDTVCVTNPRISDGQMEVVDDGADYLSREFWRYFDVN